MQEALPHVTHSCEDMLAALARLGSPNEVSMLPSLATVLTRVKVSNMSVSWSRPWRPGSVSSCARLVSRCQSRLWPSSRGTVRRRRKRTTGTGGWSTSCWVSCPPCQHCPSIQRLTPEGHDNFQFTYSWFRYSKDNPFLIKNTLVVSEICHEGRWFKRWVVMSHKPHQTRDPWPVTNGTWDTCLLHVNQDTEQHQPWCSQRLVCPDRLPQEITSHPLPYPSSAGETLN